MESLKVYKSHIAILLLAIFYSVGLVGISMAEYRESILDLTPFNLLLTLGILIWVHEDFSPRLLTAFVVVFSIGYLVELAGVHTGVLFGEYQYGEPLGWKLWEVPLMIGVNWFLLAYAGRALATVMTDKPWLQVVTAALVMVVVDILIEPVAVALDFWTWDGGTIPIQNYVMWLVTALAIQFFLMKFYPRVNTRIGLAVLLAQVVFFGVLGVVL